MEYKTSLWDIILVAIDIGDNQVGKAETKRTQVRDIQAWGTPTRKTLTWGA